MSKYISLIIVSFLLVNLIQGISIEEQNPIRTAAAQCGNGLLDEGVCVCNNGYTGTNCTIAVGETLYPNPSYISFPTMPYFTYESPTTGVQSWNIIPYYLNEYAPNGTLVKQFILPKFNYANAQGTFYYSNMETTGSLMFIYTWFTAPQFDYLYNNIGQYYPVYNGSSTLFFSTYKYPYQSAGNYLQLVYQINCINTCKLLEDTTFVDAQQQTYFIDIFNYMGKDLHIAKPTIYTVRPTKSATQYELVFTLENYKTEASVQMNLIAYDAPN